MNSQGHPINSEHQAFRTMNPSICTTCGVEWFSDQKLRRKINILEEQHGILNDQLFRAGHANQINDLHVRNLYKEREGYAALAESSKNDATGLQRRLDSQEASLQAEVREHACAVQSLEHESARRKATERWLEHERATVQKLTSILDKLELSNRGDLSIDLPDTLGLGTVFHQWDSQQSEMEGLRDDLQCATDEVQDKQLTIENLTGNFEMQSHNMSDTSFLDSDEETSTGTAELQAVSALQGMARQVG